VTSKELIYDLTTIDMTRVVSDIETIRKYNPQRYEMEQLTAIVYENREQNICIGYKDVTDQEFWVRGHMPGLPLMPGVVMLEGAAQLCSYYTQKFNLMESSMVGFGGLEEVRFRDPVRPGSRLVFLCKLLKTRPRRMIISEFQGVVGDALVVEGIIKGIPIPVDLLSGQTVRS
jgi:3-hydroxyacyl-[acyl-carrier-protein] dehydratase